MTNQETVEQTDFRRHCREWLEHNTPPPPLFKPITSGVELVTEEQLAYYTDWQRAAFQAGLIGCDYPTAYGGGGRTKCQAIANQEMQRATTPVFASAIGLGMAAPVLLLHGSEDLKRQLLPRLFSGEDLWCQGFSEPGAGSDLAGVQTFAERQANGGWKITGHKVWTSTAHFADWMILLARTDRAKKYEGLTFFVVPIKSERDRSVTVRPLIKITGETGFNEVIFDGLEIDDRFRVDEVGAGWKVAMTTLAHERSAGQMVGAAAGGQRATMPKDVAAKDFPLLELARTCVRNGRPVIEDPVACDKVMRLLIRSAAIKQHRRMRSVPTLADVQRLSLQDKLLSTEYMQDSAAAGLEIEGPLATLSHFDSGAPQRGRWPLAYLSSFGATIAGGTNEIQRNILGERVLGLEKSK